MSKLFVFGSLIFLSLLTFFDTAMDSMDIRSSAEENVTSDSIIVDNLIENIEVKSVDTKTLIYFKTLSKFRSNIYFGDSREMLVSRYVVNKNVENNHRIELSNLDKGKQYFFQVELVLENGTSYFSKIYNFKTSR